MALKAGRVGVNPRGVSKDGMPIVDLNLLNTMIAAKIADALEDITVSSKSGNPVNISDAIGGAASALMINLNFKQDGTGTPTPSNVRDIEAYTGCTITVTDGDSHSKTYTIAISLDNAVYSGTVDLITGEVTIDSAIVDLGEYSYSYNATDDKFYSTTAPIDGKQDASGYTIGVCEVYTQNNDYSSMSDNQFRLYNNRIYIKDTRYTSGADLKTALDGVHMAYKLASPVKGTITPVNVQLNKGTNVITTENGNTVDINYLSV